MKNTNEAIIKKTHNCINQLKARGFFTKHLEMALNLYETTGYRDALILELRNAAPCPHGFCSRTKRNLAAQIAALANRLEKELPYLTPDSPLSKKPLGVRMCIRPKKGKNISSDGLLEIIDHTNAFINMNDVLLFVKTDTPDGILVDMIAMKTNIIAPENAKDFPILRPAEKRNIDLFLKRVNRIHDAVKSTADVSMTIVRPAPGVRMPGTAI